MLSKIWTAFLCIAWIGAMASGRMAEVSQAAAQGAGQAIKLLIEMIGLMMFWSWIFLFTVCLTLIWMRLEPAAIY